MISFWEREWFTTYDYIVAGSGIVGLSTAVSLKERYPQCTVLVLERGLFPSGASTKNAGFACIGSLSELLADLQTTTPDEVVALLEMRHRGLLRLRERLGDAAIDYRALGSYELISNKELPCLDQMDEINALLYPLLGGNAFERADKYIDTFGFSTTHVKAMIRNCFEGQLDTGRMMRSLLQYAQSLGVVVINGANILHFEQLTADSVQVNVRHEAVGSDICFKANKLAICTNAFAQQLMPHLDLYPGRGQVLITQPIEGLRWQGIFHFDEGYYYFRNYGNRVLFGGGRNLDFEGETSTDFTQNHTILAALRHLLATLILPNQPFEIDMTWVGIMAFGKSKMPHIGYYSPSVVYGVKLSGMGVAIGSLLGDRLADMLLDG